MKAYGVKRALREEEDSLQTSTGCTTRHEAKVRKRRVSKKEVRSKVKRYIYAEVNGLDLNKKKRF